MSNTQTAPYPEELAVLVAHLTYKAGWEFTLESIDRGQASIGLTLIIQITTPDSYHPERMRIVNHYFPVPPAAYMVGAWQRWLFEQVLQVEKHEAMEFFTVEGQKPFAPNHGPGQDPYAIKEVTTEKERRTSYLGVVREK